MPLQWNNGHLLWNNGHLMWECCCGESSTPTECPELCDNCCETIRIVIEYHLPFPPFSLTQDTYTLTRIGTSCSWGDGLGNSLSCGVVNPNEWSFTFGFMGAAVAMNTTNCPPMDKNAWAVSGGFDYSMSSISCLD